MSGSFRISEGTWLSARAVLLGCATMAMSDCNLDQFKGKLLPCTAPLLLPGEVLCGSVRSAAFFLPVNRFLGCLDFSGGLCSTGASRTDPRFASSRTGSIFSWPNAACFHLDFVKRCRDMRAGQRKCKISPLSPQTPRLHRHGV